MNRIGKALSPGLVAILLLGGLVVAVYGGDLSALLADYRDSPPGGAAEPADAEGPPRDAAQTRARLATARAKPPTGLGSADVPPAGDRNDTTLGPTRAAIDADPPPPTVDWEFQMELVEYLGRFDGQYGMALLNLDTGQTVLVNADQPFHSASTYKVLILYRVFQLFETDALSPEDVLTITGADALDYEPYDGLYPDDTVTVAEAMEGMITLSSNAAARALVRLVGGWGTLHVAANELGMSQTGMEGEYFWTTPDDMLLFFEALARGRLLSEKASEGMLQILRRQTLADRIPALLPEEAVAAHKTGELPGVRNDVGIVVGPGGRYVICVFSRWADEEEATVAIAEVSRRAYERYAG